MALVRSGVRNRMVMIEQRRSRAGETFDDKGKAGVNKGADTGARDPILGSTEDGAALTFRKWVFCCCTRRPK